MKKVAAILLSVVAFYILAEVLFNAYIRFRYKSVEELGSSMEPTIQNSQVLLYDPSTYQKQLPKRGDIIIFRSSYEPNREYISRVIALPGEQIKIQEGLVFINNVNLAEPYIKGQQTPAKNYPPEGKFVNIPEGHYFVMCDNRTHSSDSREYGPIEFEDILGKVVKLR